MNHFPLEKRRILLSSFINTMVADDLAMHGARASVSSPRRDGRVVKVLDSGLRVTCNSATRGSNTSAATGHLRCRSEQAA